MPELLTAAVVDNEKLTETARALTIEAQPIIDRVSPGQFMHIRCGEENLLRRPISICDVNGDRITLVVEARGAGTEWLCRRRPGDVLDCLGPLGHGFDTSGKNLVFCGGGIGVPPLLYAAKKAAGRKTAILGFRNKACVLLKKEFASVCDGVTVTTDDGSAGEQGFVTAPLERLLQKGGVDGILACGPKSMLRAVAKLAEDFKAPCQVSLEERMGCGIGACLVCACKTMKDGGEHMSHVCKDGPVFNAGEVCWS
jgi:dihydroorotate dehydrogenase electron transfer subunit